MPPALVPQRPDLISTSANRGWQICGLIPAGNVKVAQIVIRVTPDTAAAVLATVATLARVAGIDGWRVGYVRRAGGHVAKTRDATFGHALGLALIRRHKFLADLLGHATKAALGMGSSLHETFLSG